MKKCYHATTSKFLPKYNWISQTSATERKYRCTNIEEGGICYRLYPHSLFNEKINENVNAEMARQPLLVSYSYLLGLKGFLMTSHYALNIDLDFLGKYNASEIICMDKLFCR